MAANNATILELNEHADAKQYTVAAATSISKGDLLKLSADNTAIISSGDDVYAGVASADKDGTDSSTKLGVYVPGSLNRYDMTVAVGGSVTLGSMVKLSGANAITDAVAADLLTGKVIGRSEETGTAGEVIVVLS